MCSYGWEVLILKLAYRASGAVEHRLQRHQTRKDETMLQTNTNPDCIIEDSADEEAKAEADGILFRDKQFRLRGLRTTG